MTLLIAEVMWRRGWTRDCGALVGWSCSIRTHLSSDTLILPNRTHTHTPLAFVVRTRRLTTGATVRSSVEVNQNYHQFLSFRVASCQVGWQWRVLAQFWSRCVSATDCIPTNTCCSADTFISSQTVPFSGSQITCQQLSPFSASAGSMTRCQFSSRLLTAIRNGQVAESLLNSWPLLSQSRIMTVHYRVYKNQPLVPCREPINPLYAVPRCFLSPRYVLILSYCPRLSLARGWSSSVRSPPQPCNPPGGYGEPHKSLDDVKRPCHSWSGEWEGAVWWEQLGADLQGRCGCMVLGRCFMGWRVLDWGGAGAGGCMLQ